MTFALSFSTFYICIFDFYFPLSSPLFRSRYSVNFIRAASFDLSRYFSPRRGRSYFFVARGTRCTVLKRYKNPCISLATGHACISRGRECGRQHANTARKYRNTSTRIFTFDLIIFDISLADVFPRRIRSPAFKGKLPTSGGRSSFQANAKA